MATSSNHNLATLGPQNAPKPSTLNALSPHRKLDPSTTSSRVKTAHALVSSETTQTQTIKRVSKRKAFMGHLTYLMTAHNYKLNNLSNGFNGMSLALKDVRDKADRYDALKKENLSLEARLEKLEKINARLLAKFPELADDAMPVASTAPANSGNPSDDSWAGYVPGDITTHPEYIPPLEMNLGKGPREPRPSNPGKTRPPLIPSSTHTLDTLDHKITKKFKFLDKRLADLTELENRVDKFSSHEEIVNLAKDKIIKDDKFKIEIRNSAVLLINQENVTTLVDNILLGFGVWEIEGRIGLVGVPKI